MTVLGLLAGLAATTAIVACAEAGAPQPPAAAANPPATFDSRRAWDDLRTIVGFGPRPSGSAALDQTRRYILSELKKAGVTAREQSFTAETPLGAVKMSNVIGTIPGVRPERLVFAGHIDTKLFREFRFVGASDGGSSAAFLIELARALSGRRHAFTIELLFLDGEEAVVEWEGTDHTYGSRHYVEEARRAGTLAGLEALVLVDMIGDRNLNLLRDSHSTTWLTDIIWSTAKRLGHGGSFLDQSTAIEDDHIPFLQAGVPAVDLIDLDYAAWHTPNDTLDQVSARSLQVVGDVVMAALPAIEARVQKK